MPHEATRPDDLVISTHRDPIRRKTIISMAGELDMATGPVFRDHLFAAIDGGADDVVLDLARVSFLDSAALSVIVGGLVRIRRLDGVIRLAGCRPAVVKVLSLTSLDRVFPMYTTVTEAIAAGTEGATGT